MRSIQDSMEEILEGLPHRMLSDLVGQKLGEQGVTLSALELDEVTKEILLPLATADEDPMISGRPWPRVCNCLARSSPVRGELELCERETEPACVYPVRVRRT